MTEVAYSENPAMFRNHPFWFILCVLLIAAFGLGILLLLFWWIGTKATLFQLQDNSVLLEEGLLSKKRTQLDSDQVRTVSVSQSFFDRIFNVGQIDIYTAGDRPEITVKGMPNPLFVRDHLQGAKASRNG